ncbi:phospho-sugar mutase [Tsukamurella sp. 8F]|uniref:phospho-sugar mutase n=1 Tax=unclassified Tsukamurella TaxID=2633480 RepID=UPI0023B93853|nr:MULTISPECIES: phospho-sugar mutase [unclassified Tsukamurella]MDF0528970.1 phospho-sugar mutase [Tsukamurella sp. 8J]MDF0587343.1 phospho-sugar mutase [Tsukamurella sp. 8F]
MTGAGSGASGPNVTGAGSGASGPNVTGAGSGASGPNVTGAGSGASGPNVTGAGSGTNVAAEDVRAWIDGDPDPVTRAEVAALSADDIVERFSTPLTFGTAGLRGPVRGGPAGMNVATVTRATWAVGSWLSARCLGGSAVVVGRDARHGSEEFFAAATEVLAAQGFSVIALPDPAPTPYVAFATRHFDAAAGIQITASHNPPADNGYKVYVSGGPQLTAPADREIEALIASAPPASAISRTPVVSDERALALADLYLDRAASRAGDGPRDLRIALTPMHGVGGAPAVEALQRSGFTDVHLVDEQFAPDGAFPTVSFPNPEEPGATDLLLALAERVDADIAIALDPDADRCAIGARTTWRASDTRDLGGWSMLTGDQAGALLGDHVLASSDARDPLVATTIVSSELLGAIAAGRGARCARTLTGFKNLMRAGDGLVFAYEEALGLAVDPDAVRDKDGISAAVVAAAYAAALKSQGRTVFDALDDLYARHGVHLTAQVSRRVTDVAQIASLMARLRADPPPSAAGVPLAVADLLTARPAADALVFTGDGVRITVRPSGTEPKAKFYLEVVEHGSVSEARSSAQKRLDSVTEAVRAW